MTTDARPVLVVAEQPDASADMIVDKLNQRDVPVVHFDTAKYPQQLTLTAGLLRAVALPTEQRAALRAAAHRNVTAERNAAAHLGKLLTLSGTRPRPNAFADVPVSHEGFQTRRADSTGTSQRTPYRAAKAIVGVSAN
ncbi:hypothetical protein [Streptomyces cadmiisoli]|uniref:hypothetical protein n=1 Tax=Streptomyces cadmiisoli TaxID=2184053 RepID=UPI003653EF38